MREDISMYVGVLPCVDPYIKVRILKNEVGVKGDCQYIIPTPTPCQKNGVGWTLDSEQDSDHAPDRPALTPQSTQVYNPNETNSLTI